MHTTILRYFFLLVAVPTLAQNFEKVSFDTDDPNGYYLAVVPQGDEVKGVLVLLPGFGQNAESIFPETKIHKVAYLNGILTIAIAGGRKLYADESVMRRLNAALVHVKNQYKVSEHPFVIGGFSAGGTIGLRFAEYAHQHPNKAEVLPTGVFTVDAPIDLFDIWNYFQREMEKGFSDAGVGEAKFVSAIMQKEIGTPTENKERYKELTPFHAASAENGNEQYLKNVAVRVYHDVDISWQLKNRRRSLFDSNALAASELISRLLSMGNQRAEFIQANGTGYRSNGNRHPHSWSIVDEVGLIQWINTLFAED
jgi:pimeloyl-ACP methyl ester carboxylesterase